MKLQLVNAVMFVLLASASVRAADPWADHVVSYDPGTGVGNDFVTGAPFTNASVALGMPTRFTSEPENFGGPTTPSQSAYRADEIVTLGEGGSLEVQFDEPVVDDPLNPFGIDLLVFGNAFFGFGGGPLVTEGGVISVSDDGVNWVAVPGVEADGLFPTLGYSDVTEPFPTSGSVPTNFTLPVDPSLSADDLQGLSTSEIVALYNGSGGGAGIDIGSLGFSSISFVRITNPLGSGVTPEIDGFADVRGIPEPASVGLTLVATVALLAGRPRRWRT